MKVCFVIQKIAGLTGGAERILCEVASAMAARGMEVSVLTYDSRAGEPSYPLVKVRLDNLFPAPYHHPSGGTGPRRLEMAIKSVPNIWPLAQLKWQLTYGRFIKALNRRIAEEKPDVVVGFMPTGIMAATLAASPLGIPTIASTHNVPAQDYCDQGRWDQNPVYRSHRWDALTQASRILVLQDAFADWFGPTLAPKITTMPNPIAPASNPPDKARSKMVIGVGRLTDVKRWDRLIAAFARISSDHPDWKLRIYGEGPEWRSLSDQINALRIQDKARLCGNTDRIMDAYADAAILCHPAAFEGFGLSVGEALAHGVPVIADANCTGVNVLVEHNRNGLLVDTEMDLAGALSQLIGNDELRERLSKAAPSTMSRYAPEMVFDRWEALLTSCKSTSNLV